MKIRKAKKGDLNQYLELVRKSNKEYSKIIGEKIKFTDKQIKKDFTEFIESKNKIILIVEENKRIIGYLVASFVISSYQKMGYIDFLFLSKNYRGSGIAKSLIKEFTRILKNKKIKKCKLSVSIKNKAAINYFEKSGFKKSHYEMIKRLK